MTGGNRGATRAVAMRALIFLLASSTLPECLLGLELTPAQKAESLDIHNQLRRSVYPQASDINYLTWNNRLEWLAQLAANSCRFEHNYGGAYENLGENLYQGFRSNASQIITYFFLENLAYDYSKKLCVLPNVFNLRQCGHYFQVVGSTLTEVGCAIQLCGEGRYLFVCEYDKSYPGYIYTAGVPCTACPSTSGYCLRGLCVNGSLAKDAELQARQGNASCSVQCKNCGVRTDNWTASLPVCECVCPTGYRGTDCSVKSSDSAVAAPVCSPCTAAGTPCLNGGWEAVNSSSCTCQCPRNFTGPQCQLATAAYTGAVLLTLRGGLEFCSGGCAKIPIDPSSFQQRIWPVLSASLSVAVNAYCANAANFALCCPNSSLPAGAISGSLLTPADVNFVDFSLKSAASGDLEVAVYAVPSTGNSLCGSAGTGRRTKRAASDAPSVIPSSILTVAVSSINSTSLNGLSVASATNYKTVADLIFGYGSASCAMLDAGCWKTLVVLISFIVAAVNENRIYSF